MKWLWRFASDEQGLWKEAITSRYLEDHWITKTNNNPYGVGVWRSIRNQWPKLWGSSKILLGNVRKTSFWHDVWVGQQTLKPQFPIIYNLSQQKWATVFDISDIHDWNLSFRRLFNDWEVNNLTEFYKTI